MDLRLNTRKEVTMLYDAKRDIPFQLEAGDTGKTFVRHVLGFSRLRGHFYGDGAFSCFVRQAYAYGEVGGEYFVYDHSVCRLDAGLDVESGRYVVSFDLPIVGRYAQVYIENTAGNAITVSGMCYAI